MQSLIGSTLAAWHLMHMWRQSQRKAAPKKLNVGSLAANYCR